MKIEKGLFFDELDEFIIRKIILCYKEKKELDTWHLSKLFVSSFYKRDIDSIYSLQKIEVDGIYRKIQRKILHYKNFGIISVSKNGGGRDAYDFDMDSVTIAKHKFSDGFHNCLIIRL